MEFNSDKEYWDAFMEIRSTLISKGWIQTKADRKNKPISMIVSKGGYSAYILFGCDEEIKNEIID